MSPHKQRPFLAKTKIGTASSLILCAVFSILNYSAVSAAAYTAALSTDGDIELNVSVNGDRASSVVDNLTVVSTCPYGYTVSISGPSDSALYKDGDKTSSSKIDVSTGTIESPASILGDNYGTWGFTTESTQSSSMLFAGLTNSPVILATSSSPTSASGETIPIYYGASVKPDIVPGSYTMAESSTGAGDNVITYFLTTSLNCTSYQVAFNPTSTANGSSVSGTGTMENQRISEGTATNLDQASFTPPSGLFFDSWNTAQDGSGTSYANGASVTDLAPAGNTITLYAQWSICNPSGTTIDTIGCMQDISSNNKTSILNSMTVDEQYQLYDSRDKKQYYVSKLSDGNIWMTQNLDFELSTNELSSLDTDLTDNSLSGAYQNGYRVEDSIIYWTPSKATITDGSSSETNLWPQSNTLPESISLGDYYLDEPKLNSYVNTSNTPFSSNGEHGALGNHYNWTAAIASNDSSSLTTLGDSANNSICPAGWRLPYANGDKSQSTLDDFNRLLNIYDYDKIGEPPLYFIDSTSVNTTEMIQQMGYLGFYWTSAVNSSTEAYNLEIYTTVSINGTVSNGNRYSGMAIRCMAR